MKSALLAAAALLLVSPIVSASDLTLVSKVTGSTTGVVTTYMTATAVRSNDSKLQFDVMTDLKNGVVYRINHKAKTVGFTKFADVPGLVEAMNAHQPKGKGAAEFNAGMSNVYGDPSIFKVENVGKGIIIGRPCNKTRITAGNLVREVCMDPSLKSPVDPAVWLKAERSGYAGLAAYANMSKIMNNIAEAMSRLDGVALKTHSSGFNTDTDVEVTSISQGAIAASTFALPTGYTTTDQIAETEKKLMASRH